VITDFESRDDSPWFLYLTPFAPHEPFTAESDYANAPIEDWSGNPAVFEADRSDKPQWVRTAKARFADGRAHRLAQLRTLLSVDDLVAQVSDRLEALGEENTLAFFLSDNGYMWAEHGLLDKSKPYLQSIEIPFFARWAGHLPAGSVSDRLVATVDLVPTILDATGVSSDPAVPVDGESLLQAVERERMLTENWEWRPWASLRGSGYQYIEWYDDAGAVIFREYYDLATDPWQLENLLSDADPLNDPDVSALSEQLARDRTCVGTSGEAACPTGSPTLSIGDAVPVTEGGPGTKVFSRFTVSMSSPSSEPVTFMYSTADDTASAGTGDYTSVTAATLTIPAGATTSLAVRVVVRGDALDEPDETFFVNLSNPNGATIADGQGVGTIIDDDP